MRCLQDIDIEIIVHKNRAAHGGHSDCLFPDLEIVNGLCHQSMGNPVMTSRTEVEWNVNQDILDV